MYVVPTTNDSFVSGNYLAEVWNSFGIKNDADGSGTSLGSLIYEASASQILDVWWRDQAVWNSTYVRWGFPSDFYLQEGDQVFRGFKTGYSQSQIPVSVFRCVNRTLFNGTGYQLVNVTIVYQDTNFSWASINVNLWDERYMNPEIVGGTFYTDAPVQFYEEKPWHIHAEFNRSEMLPGKPYNVSFIIK